MREVKVFKWEQQEVDGKWKNLQVFDCIALFHAFGQEAAGEGQSNPVAIVERADGKVQTVVPWMIEFVDGPKGADTPAALRDQFAGRALAALISLPHKEDYKRGAQGVPVLAKYAYEYADAMLAERAQ